MKYIYTLLALGCMLGAYYIATIEGNHMYITACGGKIVEYTATTPLSTEDNETLCRAIEISPENDLIITSLNIIVIRVTDVFTNEMTIRFGDIPDEDKEKDL